MAMHRNGNDGKHHVMLTMAESDWQRFDRICKTLPGTVMATLARDILVSALPRLEELAQDYNEGLIQVVSDRAEDHAIEAMNTTGYVRYTRPKGAQQAAKRPASRRRRVIPKKRKAVA